MIIVYDILFNLHVLHSYYEDEKCSDLIIAPPAPGKHLFDSLKLLFKQRDDAGIVLYEHDEGVNTPRVEMREGTILTLVLRPKSADFYTLTDLGTTGTSGTIAYYNSNVNTVADGKTLLTKTNVLCRPMRFNFLLTTGSTGIRLKDRAGTTLVTEVYTPRSAGSLYQFDAAGYPAGLYTIEETVGAVSTETKVYLDNVLAAEKILGIVEVVKTASPFPKDLYIRFEARKMKWKYYVIASEKFKTNDFIIEDKGPLPERVNFPEFTDPDHIRDLLKTSSNNVIVFESETALSFKDRPKSNIVLSMIKNGSKIPVVAHLPNPSIRKPVSEMYINV